MQWARFHIVYILAAGMSLSILHGWVYAAEPKGAIDYNRSIRPILSDRCFKCHGPDAAERKSGLRLDLRDDALRAAESGEKAIVPGKSTESRLVSRIFSKDADEQMPPPDSNKKLTDAERDLLKKWIEQGAPYQSLWSFVAPKRPPLPKVKQPAWPRNSVDHFILARLEAEGLSPSPEADKTTLIRRLTLDLTGLPPTPAEVDAFLADSSPAAYEKLVDRLLGSRHYGERMAMEWLDAARYADTHGFHIDSGRDMTRWREWVIDSFNRNQPFSQFTIEQLAGDLLPSATLEQKVASGFNRNHMINFEGGAIPQEYHNAYIVDRVNTTGTVWLGLTVACTQCHDHKYDPLSQKEFYQLYAFFHNVPENGLDGSKGNAAPLLKAPTAAQQKEFDRLAAEIVAAEKQLAAPLPAVDVAQAAWEKSALAEQKVVWSVLDPSEFKSQGGAKFSKLGDKSLLASGPILAADTHTVTAETELAGITAIRLEALPDDSLAAKGPGRSENGNIVLTEVKLVAGPAGDAGKAQPLKIKTASADFSQKDFPVAAAIDGKPNTGWAIHPEVGKAHAAVFELETPLASEKSRLTVTLEFHSQFAGHQLGRFRLAVTSAKQPHGEGKLPANIAEALTVVADKRNEKQTSDLRTYYRTNASPEMKALTAKVASLKQAQADLDKQIGTTMVMQEMPTPRDTFVLVRGQYDKQGEKVTAGVPASLPPLASGAPANRLGLAQWLVDPAHPLTSRVIVNRYWQMLFGTGLVKTSEDFGSQGELPSHAELLDWLAVEFREPSEAATGSTAQPDGGSAWNVKSIVKLLVMSATYRQASIVPRELLARDPENRLLARGTRQRLHAEFIRDQALAVSGLLNDQIGGASVSPYQPAGIWEELASRADGANWTAQTYKQSTGKDLYRRTMYTYWKRTAPPPSLMTFDTPDRETCTVRRSRTNTPLQALVLLNDPTYVEASRKLAERIMGEEGKTTEERIAFAFRLATARRPSVKETAVLTRLFDTQLAAYRQSAPAAEKLLAVGESKRNSSLDVTELAAWTMVASAILNLDETVTKG